MRNWMREHHVLMRLISLLTAIFLWLYVVYMDNPEKTVSFSEIPVRFLNEDSMRSRYGLVLVEEDVNVSVRLSGTFSRLEKLSEDDVRATADLGRITQAGTYTLSYDIAAVDGVTVVERSPAELTVVVDELVTVELPVHVSVTGTMPEGLVADHAVADPVTVRVTGLSSELESAVIAEISIPAGELTGPYSAELPYTILDASGNPIESETITRTDETVRVDIPVYRERTIPVSVEVTYGNGATVENTIVSLSREEITVYGDIEAVEAMEPIVLDTLDVSAMTGEYHHTYTLELPEGVMLRDGDDTVSVDITYDNLETRQIVVTDIRIVNIPLRYSVASDTSEVRVTVRGTPEMLDGLVSGDIALQADLSGVELISGMQKVDVTVILGDSVSSLGVFGEYSIVIRSEKLSGTTIFN